MEPVATSVTISRKSRSSSIITNDYGEDDNIELELYIAGSYLAARSHHGGWYVGRAPLADPRDRHAVPRPSQGGLRGGRPHDSARGGGEHRRVLGREGLPALRLGRAGAGPPDVDRQHARD